MSASNIDIDTVGIGAATTSSLGVGSVVAGGGAGVLIGGATLGASLAVKPWTSVLPTDIALEVEKVNGTVDVTVQLALEKCVDAHLNPSPPFDWIDEKWEADGSTTLSPNPGSVSFPLTGTPAISVSLPASALAPRLTIDTSIDKADIALPATMSVTTSDVSLSEPVTLSTHVLQGLHVQGLPAALAGLSFASLSVTGASASGTTLDRWSIESASTDGAGAPFRVLVGTVDVAGIPPLRSDQRGTLDLGDLPLGKITIGSIDLGTWELVPQKYRVSVRATIACSITLTGVKVRNLEAELSVTQLTLKNVVVPVQVDKIRIGDAGSPVALSGLSISTLTAS